MERRDDQITLRLPSVLLKELREDADKDRRSLASYMINALEDHLNNNRVQHDPKKAS